LEQQGETRDSGLVKREVFERHGFEQNRSGNAKGGDEVDRGGAGAGEAEMGDGGGGDRFEGGGESRRRERVELERRDGRAIGEGLCEVEAGSVVKWAPRERQVDRGVARGREGADGGEHRRGGQGAVQDDVADNRVSHSESWRQGAEGELWMGKG
jgi:hypothetical protein